MCFLVQYNIVSKTKSPCNQLPFPFYIDCVLLVLRQNCNTTVISCIFKTKKALQSNTIGKFLMIARQIWSQEPWTDTGKKICWTKAKSLPKNIYRYFPVDRLGAKFAMNYCRFWVFNKAAKEVCRIRNSFE